ncbi:MAG: hypothetical protein AAGF15_12140, partial [Pseudomonadota bacterium]
EDAQALEDRADALLQVLKSDGVSEANEAEGESSRFSLHVEIPDEIPLNHDENEPNGVHLDLENQLESLIEQSDAERARIGAMFESPPHAGEPVPPAE